MASLLGEGRAGRPLWWDGLRARTERLWRIQDCRLQRREHQTEGTDVWRLRDGRQRSWAQQEKGQWRWRLVSRAKADAEEASTVSLRLEKMNVILSAVGIYSRDFSGEDVLWIMSDDVWKIDWAGVRWKGKNHTWQKLQNVCLEPFSPPSLLKFQFYSGGQQVQSRVYFTFFLDK